MSKAEDRRLLAEHVALKALLDRCGCDIYGWNSIDDVTAIDRATGACYPFSMPALRRIRELEAKTTAAPSTVEGVESQP